MAAWGVFRWVLQVCQQVATVVIRAATQVHVACQRALLAASRRKEQLLPPKKPFEYPQIDPLDVAQVSQVIESWQSERDVLIEPELWPDPAVEQEEEARGIGLPNRGNTCFINAVLQCLAALPEFARGLESHVAKLERKLLHRASNAVKFELGATLAHVLCILCNDQEARANHHRTRIEPALKRFVVAASRCTDLVARGASSQIQQDAEEFLTFLLDALHDLLKKPCADTMDPMERVMEQERLLQYEQKYLQYLRLCRVTQPETYVKTVCALGDVRWSQYLQQNDSFITRTFSGQMLRGSQCLSCANLTCLHQHIRVMPVSINTSAIQQTLESCLAAHRTLEELAGDNRVFCDAHCKGKTSRVTQILLQRAPPVLIIQLQRFEQSYWQTSLQKVATPVYFPSGHKMLDMTENMFVRDALHPVQYELMAVCAHLGSSLDCGHYIAYTRDRESTYQWLKFDDNTVTVVDQSIFRAETLATAYLLFYVRKEHKKEKQEFSKSNSG